ncbi:MAG: prolipoprotein diacylglyceryl transferase [Bauldia sp.]|nr:prolipoprotein diacylglyceryl transferase [Bauldia sp.]
MPVLAIPYPVIDPVALDLGPLEIRWYALAYIAGILGVWLYVRRLVRNERLWGPAGSPITKRHADDFIVWATIGIVAGGRLGYVLIYDLPQFAADPISIFALWEGGMSFHGAFLGMILAMVIFARLKKIPTWSLIDVVAAGTPAALFIGRLANFVNGELYGRASDVPWAMVFPTDPLQVARHPSQLYQAGLEGLVLFIILAVLIYRFRMLRHPGFVSGAFAAGYGAFRIFGEFFREPDTQIGFLAGGLTMGMLLSIPMVIAGVAMMVWSVRRGPRQPAPATG